MPLIDACKGSEGSDDKDNEEGVDWVQCDECEDGFISFVPSDRCPIMSIFMTKNGFVVGKSNLNIFFSLSFVAVVIYP